MGVVVGLDLGGQHRTVTRRLLSRNRVRLAGLASQHQLKADLFGIRRDRLDPRRPRWGGVGSRSPRPCASRAGGSPGGGGGGRGGGPPSPRRSPAFIAAPHG